MRALKKNIKSLNNDEPFKGLFTQGMVCHETYKDKNGKWLTPDEVVKDQNGNFTKISDKSSVTVGPSESMSKSKKNVIDPENMIKTYGADAVRGLYSLTVPPRKTYSGLTKG